MRRLNYWIVALAFGLAWALRGHFGHEHGAAWAGAVATFALLLVSNRSDWIIKAPQLATAGAIGWGMGGMMSYGLLVGYGRGIDLPNVLYGLTMLAVVGGLYGFTGGGLLGLGLESSDVKKADWARLLTQMVAGGALLWAILIAQLGWRMTPPRSELWSACLGASMALAWYLHQNGFYRALRLAGYSALGTGFGFAFGNFLQTVGASSSFRYNWWNLMEFSLGFFGGLGLAYGVFTRDWPRLNSQASRSTWPALLFLFLAVPATNLIQAFSAERLQRQAQELGVRWESFLMAQRGQAWLLVTVALIAAVALWRRPRHFPEKTIRVFPSLFFLYLVCFVLVSNVRKALLHTGWQTHPEHFIYWLLLLLLIGLWMRWRQRVPPVLFHAGPPETGGRWGALLAVLLLVLIALAGISTRIHDELPGAHTRF